MNERQAIAWLSERRFEPFLVAVGGGHNRAAALYHWHAELSAATFAMLHGFEVLLRNAVDATLGDGQPEAPLNDTWLLDLDTLRPGALKQVVVALERLGANRPVTRGQVVAQLSLGFWVMLFGRRYDQLWQTRLHRALPAAAGRTEVVDRIGRVHQLRNRIAHHDSLLDQDVSAHVADMLALAGWIDPAAPGWLRRVADVEAVLRRRP